MISSAPRITDGAGYAPTIAILRSYFFVFRSLHFLFAVFDVLFDGCKKGTFFRSR